MAPTRESVRAEPSRPTGFPSFRGNGQGPVIVGDTEVPRAVYRAIMQGAAEYDLPHAIMFELAHAENETFDPTARLHTSREDSVGIYQNNRKGGLGSGYTVAELEDIETNVGIAFSHIRRELDAGKTLYKALWPWETARERILGE